MSKQEHMTLHSNSLSLSAPFIYCHHLPQIAFLFYIFFQKISKQEIKKLINLKMHLLRLPTFLNNWQLPSFPSSLYTALISSHFPHPPFSFPSSPSIYSHIYTHIYIHSVLGWFITCFS